MSSNTYLEFNNPIHIIWRKGTPDDPFIERLDITQIISQRTVLLEIPDELYRVRIVGMQEINYDKFIKNTLDENDFFVDYSNGFVYFHPSHEAETVSIHYKGRGVILYPSSRVVHYDGTNPSENLHDIIEDAKKQVADLIDETSNFHEVLDRMVIATNLTKEATDNAILATQEALNATELVNDAYYSTVLIYVPFVQTEAEITTTYPHPHVGWTVQVYDTGVRYRWNGQDWIPIDMFGGNIPNASEELDGLMSKEDYMKLKAITPFVENRVIAFIIPQEVFAGTQDPHIVFPFDGEIVDIRASVSKSGSSDTTIRIEKSHDYVSWENITQTSLRIPAREHFDNREHTFLNKSVKSGDVFRLYIPFSSDIQNLTLNIEIKL